MSNTDEHIQCIIDCLIKSKGKYCSQGAATNPIVTIARSCPAECPFSQDCFTDDYHIEVRYAKALSLTSQEHLMDLLL